MYEKPIVEFSNDISEVVSMDSSGECWDIECVSVQYWNGSHHVFEVRCNHSKQAAHTSSGIHIVLSFSDQISDAYSEFESSFHGNTVTIERNLHANGYYSGDNVTFKVWVKCDDDNRTRVISNIHSYIGCE